MHGDLITLYLYKCLLFYTNINILLVIFHKYVASYFDIHLSCLIVAFVAFGITYITPRKIIYEVDEKRIYVSHTGSLKSYILDFFMHWLPLIYVFLFVPVNNNFRVTIYTFLFILCYSIASSAHFKYMYDYCVSMLVTILALVVRCAIY